MQHYGYFRYFQNNQRFANCIPPLILRFVSKSTPSSTLQNNLLLTHTEKKYFRYLFRENSARIESTFIHVTIQYTNK